MKNVLQSTNVGKKSVVMKIKFMHVWEKGDKDKLFVVNTP